MERVVKYDQEAFTKAWDYLAKSPSDDEDDYKNVFFSNFFFFFGTFFTPGKGPKYGHFGADRLFLDARTCGVVREETPPQRNPTKKTKNFNKIIACGIELTKWSV